MNILARGNAPKQSGFSLLELAVVIALAAMVSIGYLYNQSQDNQLSNAKVQAGYYLTVNDAVGKYMLTFYDDLKIIPPDCSQLRLTAGGVPSAITTRVAAKRLPGASSTAPSSVVSRAMKAWCGGRPGALPPRSRRPPPTPLRRSRCTSARSASTPRGKLRTM